MMTPHVWMVNPVLLVPGGTATEEDVQAVRTAIPHIQAWFQAYGVLLLILDPKAPYCVEEWAYFADFPGGPFYAVQDMAVREGWRSVEDAGQSVKALVFLCGYPDGHGEAGLTVAVVGYGAVSLLSTAANDGLRTVGDTAAGLVAHEIGHLMGLEHTQKMLDLMSAQSWWQHFPNVGLSEKPRR